MNLVADHEPPGLWCFCSHVNAAATVGSLAARERFAYFAGIAIRVVGAVLDGVSSEGAVLAESLGAESVPVPAAAGALALFDSLFAGAGCSSLGALASQVSAARNAASASGRARPLSCARPMPSSAGTGTRVFTDSKAASAVAPSPARSATRPACSASAVSRGAARRS